MKSCLMAIIEVIDRQYKKYSSWNLDKKLEEETKSVKPHNIDAEEIIMVAGNKKSGRSRTSTAYILMRKRWFCIKQYPLGAKDDESPVFTKIEAEQYLQGSLLGTSRPMMMPPTMICQCINLRPTY